MRRAKVGIVLLVGLFVISGIARAGTPGYPVVPFEYDPDHTGDVEAGWVTHVGLPDAGNAAHALLLTKDAATAVNAAAGAVVQRVSDTVWSDQLGFDRQTDTYCGAGAPRFNVYDDLGTLHFFGCIYGTHTALGTDPQGDTWERVRFSGSDAFPPIAPGTPIAAIYIIQDETGSALLDNIFYNGAIMGQPGA